MSTLHAPAFGPRPAAGLLLALAVLAGSVLTAAPATARQEAPAGAPEPRFGGTTEVRVIEVPVQVTRAGLPVRGLQAADFVVELGDRPQPIVGFEVVDLATLGARQGEASPRVLDVPVAGRRHFLFLFDLSTADPPALARAQDAALQVVAEGLHPADLVAVAAYDPSRGARLQLAFTPDRRQAELAIRTLGTPTLIEHRPDWLGLVITQAEDTVARSENQLRNPAQTRVAERLESLPRELATREILEHARDVAASNDRAQASAAADRAEDFTRSLAELARLMQRVEGRKHVVFLSAGFDSELILGKEESPVASHHSEEDNDVNEILRSDGERRFGNTRLRGALRRTLATMREADCTIHAVDIAGLGPTGADIAADVSQGVRGQRLGKRGEDSLFVMAEQTGGALYRNFNDLGAAMERVLAATAVTYVLAIQAPEGLQGYVPLTVELARGQRGVDVAHRAGVFATPPAALHAGLEERLRIGALLLEGRAGGRLATTLMAVPLGGATEVVVEVPGEPLLADNAGDLLTAEVTVYAFGADGQIGGVARQMAGMDLRRVGGRLREGGIKLFATMALPAGEWELRSLVRNTYSGHYGIATARIAVPAAGAASPALSAAFVDRAVYPWLLVRDTSTGQPGEYPFAFGEQVLLPVGTARLGAGAEQAVWVATAAGGDAAVLEGVVRGADGTVVATAELPLLARQPAGGGERLLAGFTPPADLAAGRYTLEVRLAGAAPAMAATALPFTFER